MNCKSQTLLQNILFHIPHPSAISSQRDLKLPMAHAHVASRLNSSCSYSSRHSTIGAKTFLFDWPQDEQLQEVLQSIPSRVHQLVQHFNHNPYLAATESRSVTISLLGRDSPMEARRIALTAAVEEAASSHVWSSFQALFEKILKVYISTKGDVEESDEEDDEEEAFTLDFNEENLYRDLHTLQWLNPKNPAKSDILTPILEKALYETIHKHVSDKISGIYDSNAEHLYVNLVSWKDIHVLPMLKKMLCCVQDDNDLTPMQLLESYDQKLNHTLSECYCSIRSDEIFDIIADYPDSFPAVVDLQLALSKALKVSTIVNALKKSFRKRLLHPGAQSGQILQVYMNTIKVMRVFDPSDSLLDTVAEDVRVYLRGRSDTVRCIITSLTDEQVESDLYEELQRHDAVPLEQAQYDSDDDDVPPDMNWNPAPSKYYQRICGAMESGNVDRNADLLAMLVRIYGSNDLFVDEYRIMLADKLLASVDFDTDKEVRNLELLKLRFGEISMRQCEIMIKDMDDSKRIASNIHSTMEGKSNRRKDENPVVDAAIISHIFWPPLQKESMKNHPRIQAQLDEFSNEYAAYKKPRKLIWFQQLGSVQLELEVIEPDGEISTKEFTCSPLHATLISHFEDNDGYWTTKDLSNETGVPEDVIKKRMGFWVNQNVVKIVGGKKVTTYELASYHDEQNNKFEDFYDEDDGIIVSLSGQEEEEWEAYESYVVGMLANLGQLPLERIHNMLKTFVTGSEHKYNKTPQQLSIFLQKLCKDEKLECGADGTYKLIKR